VKKDLSSLCASDMVIQFITLWPSIRNTLHLRFGCICYINKLQTFTYVHALYQFWVTAVSEQIQIMADVMCVHSM